MLVSEHSFPATIDFMINVRYNEGELEVSYPLTILWEGNAFSKHPQITIKEVELRVRNKRSRPWFDKRDLDKLDNDWSLAFYYAVLKDYANRLDPDKKGFTRVSSKVFETDLKANRMKIWRYNKKLEDKGLIVVDRVARGRSTWIGYKLI